MHAVLELLRDNEPLNAQLKGATSEASAIRMIVDAAEQRGMTLTARDVETFLAERPRGGTQALSDEELEAVSGGRASMPSSSICCSTCVVSWIFF